MSDTLHRKLDEVIEIIDAENDTNEQPDKDYAEALNKACQLIGVENKLFTMFNTISGHFHVIITLKNELMKDLPILTGYGTDKVLAAAKQRAAFTTLTLLDKVRFIWIIINVIVKKILPFKS